MLNHYKQQAESQVAKVTEVHQRQQQELFKQLDGLNSELQHAKSVSTVLSSRVSSYQGNSSIKNCLNNLMVLTVNNSMQRA